jgi:hypothetical protein
MFISINCKRDFIYILCLFPLSLLKLVFNSSLIKKENFYITEYISKVLLINPYLYQKISEDNNQIINRKININHILLIIIIIVFYLINVHLELLNLNNFYLEIISIQFIDLVFFQKQFYSHHILSFILIIFSLPFIIINDYNNIKSIYVIILIIIKNYSENFSILLIKYVNNIYFTNIYLLGSLIGLFSSIYQLIQMRFIFDFKSYLIIYLIICFLANIMFFYIILKLGAIHATICYHISNVIVYFVSNALKISTLQFCLFIFLEIFSTLIYLEIIELNFCRFDKNLKKNIISRSIIEIYDIVPKNDRKSITSSKFFNDDYF